MLLRVVPSSLPRMRRLRRSHWAVSEETWPVRTFSENINSEPGGMQRDLLPGSSATRRCHILLQSDNPDAFTYVKRHRYCLWPLVLSAREAAPCICPGADYLSPSRNP